MAASREQFVALDGLRGVGALCVLLAHAFYTEGIPHFFAHASFGVDMFFVLSGFVIANAYQSQLQTTMSISDYLKVRTARLYPTLLIGTVLSLISAFIWGAISREDLPLLFVLQAFLIPAIGFGPLIFPLNGAYWSLFFELFANFMHALFAKHVTPWRLGAVAIGGALALIWCAVHFGKLNLGALPDNMSGGFARVIYSFTVGLLLHHWRVTGVLRAPSVHVAIPVGVLVLGMWMPVPDWPYATITHDLFATLILSPLLVMFAADARVPARWAPIMGWLALISYPLYALHTAVLDTFAQALTPETVPKLVKAVGWIVAMGLCVLLAWAVAAALEPRARRWLSGVLFPRKRGHFVRA